MMSTVFILGINGNMGQRYQAVLKHLGKTVIGTDLGQGLAGIEKADGIIIATPTEIHLQHIAAVINFQRPILCEKPLTKNLDELQRFDNKYGDWTDFVRMVNQYEFMVSNQFNGDTEYNYFKSGADGIAWDCINIVGLSKGQCIIGNSSPIWKCKINGQTLNLSNVDQSYIDMVKSWTTDPRSNFKYAKTAHEKVTAWLKSS